MKKQQIYWKQWVAVVLLALVGTVRGMADEGMWVLQELNEVNRARMAELGLHIPLEQINGQGASLAHSVVIFGGGCTAVNVSDSGLLFTNHHCGYGSIQELSSLEHDYLQDGFVAINREDELPVPDLTVKYFRQAIDISDSILPHLAGITEERLRLAAADSIGQAICDSVTGHSKADSDPFIQASVIPFYNHNRYYLIIYDVFRDVRLVFTPPQSVGKFGGESDNWTWPRHTGDVSVFRVYADTCNKPAEYDSANRPYLPASVATISLAGYTERDYAMTIGFPGATYRYLSSWGVTQRIHNVNIPRIAVRTAKQDIWRQAMRNDPAIRIKYASKFATSSNGWKKAIGMNRDLQRLHVVERKQEQEQAFGRWVEQEETRVRQHGDILALLQRGYTSSDTVRRYTTYLSEAFERGAEILRLAGIVNSFDLKRATPDEIDQFLIDRIQPFFKDYDLALDQQLLATMMRVIRDSVPAQYLPDIYPEIDRKYKGDYLRYAQDLFRRTKIDTYQHVADLLYKHRQRTLQRDPAMRLQLSAHLTIHELKQQTSKTDDLLTQGQRQYLAALQLMQPQKTFYPEANSTMRLSYGAFGGYQPGDAVQYSHYTTQHGVLEKQNPNDYEFSVQPDILALLGSNDFGPYANAEGQLPLCFLTNNDITGGNSGSPVFNADGHLLGLAFDGNWEAMSGDIIFEPQLQRTIAVDIRYILFLIDRWGQCTRIINELKYASPAGRTDASTDA